MPYWQDLIQPLGDVTLFNAGELDLKNIQGNLQKYRFLHDIEILLIRSTTKVCSSLLDYMPNLKFVGTATAGFDHLDKEALHKRGIYWTNAAGCNAQAVCQYITSTVLALSIEDNFQINQKSIAVVGFGQVGSRVSSAMAALGARIKIYDPPLAEQHEQSVIELCDSQFWQTQALGMHAKTLLESNGGFASFNDVLQADIICIHAPLNLSSKFNNKHLFNEKILFELSSEQYLINAGRGELIDNKALLNMFNSKSSDCTPHVVLDVWENEPEILRALIPYLRIATPHIAGHSLEGKAKGTYILYQAICQFLNLPETKTLSPLLPEFDVNIPAELMDQLSVSMGLNDAFSFGLQKNIKNLCNLAYVVQNDDRVFRLHMAQSTSIAELRQKYPIRREFSALPLYSLNNNINELLRKLGFIISNDSRPSH